MEGYTGAEAVARADSFRNFWVYAFCALLAVFLFGCGLDEDSTPPGGTTLSGNASNGKTLYSSLGCIGCHGSDATGGIGPNIQGDSADHIEAMAGTGPMAGVSVTSQEAADLAAYLATVETGEGAGEAPPEEATPEEADEEGEGEEADGGLVGDAANGAVLFVEKGCSGCHGADATGGIGPNIQGKSADNISAALGSVAMMSGISLTEQERLDIAAWLQTL